jgi:aminocarboxymuconate-semialdehyde decarboxylase
MPGIDVHTHLAPRLPAALEAAARVAGPVRLHRPEALVAWLAQVGLDAAVVSPPPPYFRQSLAAAEAAAWVRAVNEGILAAVAGEPALLPLAYLPLEHPELAIEEYARVRADARWAGLCASAGGASVSLADERLTPLWRALHDDARMLLLHPGHAHDPRLEAFYLANLLGNPVETAVAAAQLVFGDVLATYPSLRVLLVHCGGVVPGLVGRWERGVQTARPGLRPLTESPRQAVRRLHADCLAHDPLVVSQALETFGADKLVLGSDWPFPMGIEDPAATVAHLGEELARRIAVDNAAALLGRAPGPTGGS